MKIIFKSFYFSHNKTKQILTHRACKITAIQRIQTTKN